MIRTETASPLESTGGRPTFTSCSSRRAGEASDGAVAPRDRFLSCVGIMSMGACVTGAKLFVGLETVTMTICDTLPATGAAVSRRAIPVRATLNEISRGARAPSGGNTVTDTPIAPLVLWAGAITGMVPSAMTTAARALERLASEQLFASHVDLRADCSPVLEPGALVAARLGGVVDISK